MKCMRDHGEHSKGIEMGHDNQETKVFTSAKTPGRASWVGVPCFVVAVLCIVVKIIVRGAFTNQRVAGSFQHFRLCQLKKILHVPGSKPNVNNTTKVDPKAPKERPKVEEKQAWET